jgi:hypothetical protein
METTRFEERLSTLFRSDPSGLSHLALAECAGLSHHAVDWLRRRVKVASLWSAVREGGPLEILQSVRTAIVDPQDETDLSRALDSLIEPLTLLRRGTVIRALHAELSGLVVASFAENAAVALGACGEWNDALAILDHAHRDGANPHINLANESALWKHAYLQGEIDTVLPRLAAIPFHRDRAPAAPGRAWQLIAYRIRAGHSDIPIPVLAEGDQPFGYAEAAAMKVVALEETPSAAETVADLRRVITPHTTEIHAVDRGVAIRLTLDPLAAAEIHIAARKRDYAKLSAIADASSSSLPPLSQSIVDALLEVGDWRGAADFANRYDLRDQPVIPGFDDTRLDEHCMLQLILAAAAARGGDDAAAGAHLAEHVTALRAVWEAEREEWGAEAGAAADAETVEPALRAATVLAGAAEGVVPRPFIAMMLPVYRATY